jgi:hypothetical protein
MHMFLLAGVVIIVRISYSYFTCLMFQHYAIISQILLKGTGQLAMQENLLWKGISSFMVYINKLKRKYKYM